LNPFQQNTVTIVIVSYRTPGPLRRCLTALGTDHRVIVVDNASGDETVEMVRSEFPHVEVIANSANRGFGGANNQGAALATSDWILYLNSDCYASPGAVQRLADELNAVGAVGGGGKLLNPDGSLQQSVAGELTLGAVAREQFLLEKLTQSYWQTPVQAQRVTQVMGACLMVRRDLQLGFDESFFLYCEDTDLCQRIREHGDNWYIPEAEFTHELGTSSKKNPWLGIARYNAGKEFYFKKHRGVYAMSVCLLLDRVGALIRLILKPRQAGVWWRVLTARTSQVWPKVS
jgi:GT2 family glycosyltransferase